VEHYISPEADWQKVFDAPYPFIVQPSLDDTHNGFNFASKTLLAIELWNYLVENGTILIKLGICF